MELFVRSNKCFTFVLILIVMEDTHGAMFLTWCSEHSPSLNPYCNGRYSWSTTIIFLISTTLYVLILIVMEDTHGEVATYHVEHDSY